MHKSFTTGADAAVSVWLYTSDAFKSLENDPFPSARAIAKAQGFTGGAGQMVLVPGTDGGVAHVLGGIGDGKDALAVAALSGKLPEGVYKVAADGGLSAASIAAGWADGAYRFDRYLKDKSSPPQLAIPEGGAGEALSAEADSIALLRDLVNTPAGDMTPAGIQDVVANLAEEFGAKLTAIVGDDLLEQNYPMVHAVGRAAAAAPRFLELEWGDTSKPQLALVGKGVTFDSGGLDIKPGSGMRIMKKDMGGSAHVIALARLVMATNLPVHLKLYVPTVENAISGDAFRPGDILSSRKGLTVEIDNTDAEGRLILADALTRASECDPDLLLDFATLTGAARVALGADLAPVYSDDDQLVADVLAGSAESGDPVWRMPMWDPYLADLKSPIADLVNSGGGFGGSITAALFLKQFVDAKSWAHFDVWAWRKGKYGRPEGAAACGLRAVWAMLQKRYR
ncbi:MULTISPECIES: leucyl aminopeptidase family protein [Hyphomonas]|uniref:leucyl aminopeptidase family protein n=1 Tax=Hyphomonas TaxID=85 RepID=UPI000C67C8BB|nr:MULTISPECIES: leucyl aminopeptidase family protein [Hyphomonas]MBB38916.1 leucyl aminopeptidase [Hyphomonas sp.]|tara:strand:- start:2085 stop:3446 length:1362 start_codon:yes stop_codon:yes gene_type:complete